MSMLRHAKVSPDANRAKLIKHLLELGQTQSTETAHFHQTAAEKNGLNITDSKTLSVLMQEGPMTAGQLATRLCLTTGAVTSVLDRLEARQLIQRQADPADRRKVVITLNSQAVPHLSNPYMSIGNTFAGLFSTYTTEQLEFLVHYSETAIHLITQEISKLQNKS